MKWAEEELAQVPETDELGRTAALEDPGAAH